MSNSLIAAVLCLSVGLSFERELQASPSTIYTIDPWGDEMKYPDVKLPVNGAVQFKWSEFHGVYRIPISTCPGAFTPGNGIVALAPASSSGSFTTPPLAAGTYWYTCPVPKHCQAGQIVKVIVG
ncbi:hypothetical protein COCSUDRAFT_58874 [Coccomyxa subellipsoidea C-169]|uniref:Phytocyanin domain-containing protein n=1 Tax=Coccomyxa subellipsoidea (strain C-169) TaxID=574566 RepID=I0Z6R8_COCSC|nr:hypothetical protein COCSUDRAFT_58874 [Coccomyxa subellipsoidea C-169]EIE26337.1 hypothetical protein COCSUDRAFT_58874 [Coccomyxa subellipsoidea C-169]|eukprot:XP_005650881.1 hypothetical protein COCSUDRAFT_58874 [Coccomyxa subellipsoidea C-169]